jgi:hypothetical protein
LITKSTVRQWSNPTTELSDKSLSIFSLYPMIYSNVLQIDKRYKPATGGVGVGVWGDVRNGQSKSKNDSQDSC